MFTLPPYLLKDERVRFSVGSLENFKCSLASVHYSVALGPTRSLTEMSTKEFPWE